MLTRIAIGRARCSRAISVADREGALLLLALGRLGRVVFAMTATGPARRGGNPKVCRTGVEIDGEVLWRAPDGDRGSPHEVLLVVERYAVTLRSRERHIGVDVLFSGDSATAVVDDVDLVSTMLAVKDQ